MRFKINLECVFLLIFIPVFLQISLASSWDHSLKHEFPYSYLASDAFLHQSSAQFMKETGRIKYAAPYIYGGHNNVYEEHPTFLPQLSSTFSILSGIKVYDSIILITVFAALIIILIFYIIIRKSNVNIAMIAIPLTLLIMKQGFNVWRFWGYWLFATGVMCMAASLWAITNFELKNSFLLIGIFLAGTAIAHLPEYIFALGFMGLLFLFLLIKKEKFKQNYKKFIYAGLISIVFAIYHINVFRLSLFLMEGYRNAWDPVALRGGLPPLTLQGLGFSVIFIILGLLVFMVFLFSKKRKIFVPASVSLFTFLLGFLVLIGMGKRSYSHRQFWFIYLSFFFGLGIYQLISLILKKYKNWASFFVALILLVVFAKPLWGLNYGLGIMDKYNWDGLQWISKNIPEEAFVYYFYAEPITSNAPVYNSKRVSLNVQLNDFIEAVQTGKIQRNYKFRWNRGLTVYLCNRGFLSYGYYKDELKIDKNEKCEPGYEKLRKPPENITNKDICAIEYAYFNKVTRQPAITQYNLAIRDLLLKNEWIHEIYSNGVVSILKNDKPGVDCFGANTSQ